MKYRAEIDGLRALAVLPVILFHAGIEWFSGGYVGVDVFFVISGYLITTIIYQELLVGQFSIAKFYERRARRLLPALFLVVFSCLPFAWLWLSPEDLKLFASALIGVVTFSANFIFAFNLDYFSQAGELNPLLHTWSLAVEEQFYLLYPLLLIFLFVRGIRFLTIVLSLLAIASLGLAEWGMEDYPNANFFLLPTRAWELLVGALCALYLLRSRDEIGSVRAQVMSAIGILLILVTIVYFDDSTPMPSLIGLIPIVGTALVILFADRHTVAGKLLSYKPVVGLGLVSYSAYLWHQPVFAFARYRFSEAQFDSLIPFLILAIFPLSYFSWRFVELPFRGSSKISRASIFAGSGAMMASVVLVAIVAINLNGLPHRYSDKVAHILSFQNYPYQQNYREGKCFLLPTQQYHHFSPECVVEESSLIWGDSHAAAIFPGLKDHVSLSKYTASLCPPLIGFESQRRVHCRSINNHVLDRIAEEKHPFVFLHANWRFYEFQQVIRGLRSTVNSISEKSPDTTIVILGGVVNWGDKGLPSVLAEHIVRSSSSPDHDTQLPVNYDEVVKIDRKIEGMIEGKPNVLFLSSIEQLCNESSCIAGVRSDNKITPLAWDYGHLTGAGAQFLAARLFENPKLQALLN